MIEEKDKRNSDSALPTADRRLPAGTQTWVEVDLAALAENYRTLTSLMAPADPEMSHFADGNPGITPPRIIPVVKADAYGHGMIPVARALAAAGAGMLAVFSAGEGVELREAGISQDILVLGTSWRGQETAAIQNRLILTVDTLDCIRSLEAAAKSLRAPIPVHVKVDTGMGRLGVRWDSMESMLNALRVARGICLKGVFSHLSSAEESDPSFTLEQIRRFEHSLSSIKKCGMGCGEIHFANSAGLLYFDALRHWNARTGIALYGYHPDPRRPIVKLRPALSLKSRVGSIRSLEAGEPVGYNGRFRASRKMRLTTLCIGYADGFNRGLSNRGCVIIQDKLAPVVGTVSMDMMAVDLTDLPEAEEGDEVILLGSSAHCRVTADDWAAILRTIPYEILCAISRRIPRIYV